MDARRLARYAFRVTHRLRIGVFLPIIVVLTAVGVASALGANGRSKGTLATRSSRLATGKALYRTYCGQCHALAAAGTAGSGGAAGGPSFTNLYVPYDFAIVAVTGVRGPRAHVMAIEHLTFMQLDDIAGFLAAATSSNPRTSN
jgi:mono/diheme cytochrome c family protein